MVDRSIVTIGNFDGVHIAHQAVLDRALALGKQHAAPVVAMTFDPHPMTVLDPQRVPPRLMAASSKTRAIRQTGVRHVEVMQPTPDRLNLTPQSFLEWVMEQYHPIAFVEGPDFRFGKDRAGNVDTLRGLGRQMDFDVYVVDRVELSLTDQLMSPVSSSLTRWLLAQGRVADAARCLGRPFSLCGVVVAGQKRGKAIGVPTANLDMAPLRDHALPGAGVYAGRVTLPDGSNRLAAINVGAKPTFDEYEGAIEAHLLDFDGDLYDQPLEIEFLRWLRDQQPFPSVNALVEQLTRDIDQVRRWHRPGLLATKPVSQGQRVKAAS